jgi:hypothetical protein
MTVDDMFFLTDVELQHRTGWDPALPLEALIPSHCFAFYQSYINNPKYKDKKMFDCSQDPRGGL